MKYFVVYQAFTGRTVRTIRIEFERTEPVTSIEDVMEMEREIARRTGDTSVTIIFWQRFERSLI
jgi:hypothetical protein